MRWPRSPAKNKPFGRSAPIAARNRICDTLKSWASSTTAKLKGSGVPAAKNCPNLVNNAASVSRPRASSAARTCSKIDQSTRRCDSDNRVLRPSRATSRYASQLSSCQASTSCSHSLNRKCWLNLWSPTSSDASRSRPPIKSRPTNDAGPNAFCTAVRRCHVKNRRRCVRPISVRCSRAG